MAESSVLFDSLFELRWGKERAIFAGFVIRIRHSVSFRLNRVMNLRRGLGSARGNNRSFSPRRWATSFNNDLIIASLASIATCHCENPR